jgi:hypothetical protein
MSLNDSSGRQYEKGHAHSSIFNSLSAGRIMATLQNLPAELVTIIFDLLGDIAALRSLCLVSKYLCGIAQHLLYRNLFHESSNTSNCFLRWLFLLTNTIVSCSQLASQVRRITLDVTEDSEPCGGEGESYGYYHEANFPGAIHDGNEPRGMPHGYSLKLLLLIDCGDRYSNMTALTSLLLSYTPYVFANIKPPSGGLRPIIAYNIIAKAGALY